MHNRTPDKEGSSSDLRELLELARSMGATDAAVIPAAGIRVEDRLAGHCLEPRCPSYGLSASCPPHVSGPSGFRELLTGFEEALVFRIEVPSEILLSSDRKEIFRLLHEIAASVEQAAVRQGHARARAFAGGSCKGLFCADEATCRVVDEGGACRNPDRARPSMSGFGINVSALMEAAGWPMNRVDPGNGEDRPEMGTVSGLVLIR